MKIDDIPALMRGLRRGSVHTSVGAVTIDGGAELIRVLLPHRPPFLFVDRITAVDRQERTIEAERLVAVDDPVFEGHFPDRPVFPAALQIEAIGQASLCLWSLVECDGKPVAGLGLRVVKVEHAQFLAPVLPGDTMRLTARILEADDLLVSAMGQVYVGETLCSILIITVAIVDE